MKSDSGHKQLCFYYHVCKTASAMFWVVLLTHIALMEYAQAGYLSGSSCDLQVLCNGHVHMVPTNDDTPLNGRQISFLVRYLRLCRSERHSSTTSKSSYAPKDPIKALETV